MGRAIALSLPALGFLGGEFFPVQVTDYARGRMDAALAPLLEREKALVAENERLKAGRLLDCNEEAGPIVPCEVCPGLRTDAAWEAAESELATARADNACLAAEVERLKGELAEARKAPAEVAVTEAMVRRFVEEANPMIHPLPPPGVVRSALQAALASRDEPTKGRG